MYWLYEPVKLQRRVNDICYIDLDDRYYYSPIFIRVLANDAVEYFKQKIIELDTEGKYTNTRERLVEDVDATAALRELYKEPYELFKNWWEQYKAVHPEEFIQSYRVDGSLVSELHQRSKEFIPNLNLDVKEAIAAYKSAKELAADYAPGGSKYESLPKYAIKISSPEHINTHNKIKSEWKQELGLPEKESDLTLKSLQEVTYLKQSNAKVIKSIHADWTDLNRYAVQFVDYVCNDV